MRSHLLFAAFLGILRGTTANADPPGEPPYVCQHPLHTTQIISTSPLVVYLHNFTTPQERAHLRSMTSVNSTPRRLS